ncbi:outer membrane receptor for ferrienterochelin and colicin [Flavobacteriaceae bacterium MAR_2010_72]|nr:outer membrane receptor for ferrienterochelin and colicin [Flavobacteriaceae bacterium MAR_2010_72]
MEKMLYSISTMVNRCFLYILLSVSSLGMAQTNTPTIPLEEVITVLETQFDVKVSYAVNDVKDIFIEKPDPSLTLQETITYLNSKTLLNFKLLDDRYITVSVIDKQINICGYVISLENATPLFGATIAVNNTYTGAIANTEGLFKLENISANSVLTISFLGFETKQVDAKQLFSPDSTCKRILLGEVRETLNRVLITKFLTTGLQKLIDGSTVLNTEAFGILPGLIEPDILQSIQALPGVESVDESIANINVRGGTNDQNLVLWDGIKMYHSGHFFGLISAYNPYLTDKVIVTKNGTSTQYSDGVSSTINIFTKDKINSKINGGTGLNLISTDAFLEVPITKNVAFHISGRRSFTDVFSTPTYDNYFNRSFQDSEINTPSDNNANAETSSDFMFYDYTAKLLVDLNDNHSFRANLIGITNNLDYAESFTTSENTTESKTSNLSQTNLGYGLQWNGQWTDNFSTQLTGYYSKYNVDATDYRVETDQRLTQSNEVLDTGIKINSTLTLDPNLNVLSGYQLNETGILNETTVSSPEYELTKKDVLINHALFSEVEYRKNKTYFRAGVRVNYFQKFDKLLIEPRLNIRQKLSNRLALKLEGEFKNQSATQKVDFQEDFLGVENRRWVLADNGSIPIATSKQGSFGVEFNQNNLNIEVTSFYKLVDGITASNQGFYNNFQYVNASGSYTAKGIEFLANKTADVYSTWLSYTYSTNDYEFETFTPSKFPNNVDIRHSLSLAFNYDLLDDLQVSLGGIWRTGKPYTKPVEGNETVQNGNSIFVNYDTPNSERLDEFLRLDASVNYSFAFSEAIKASLRAGVINLTDRKNNINRYYEVNPNNSNEAIEINNTSLGLTPNFSLRINF